jgi:hypothetical protein
VSETTKINTPIGGSPNYHVALALRDNVIGSITFKNCDDLNHFKMVYAVLEPLGFGFLELHIDCEEKNDESS